MGVALHSGKSGKRTSSWLLNAVFVLSFPYLTFQAQRLGERSFKELSSGQISSLVSFPDPAKNLDPSSPSSHLSKILIPRAGIPQLCMSILSFPDATRKLVETDNNTFVKNYIASTLRALDWHIEEDSFTGVTPYGTKRFTNVVATKDPEAPRRVIVAAHFDSKYFSNYPMNQVCDLERRWLGLLNYSP